MSDAEPSRLTNDVSSADDLDELAMMVEHEGIAFNEEALPSQRKKGFESEPDEEDLELDLTPDALDKTSVGKIDKKALRARYGESKP